MKKTIFLFLSLCSLGVLQAQNDTMYIYKSGTVGKKAIADIDSIIFYKANAPGTALTVTDFDGNTYKTVTIGTQTWFAENLRTTSYKDGTPIPTVNDATAWTALSTGAQCTYNTTTDVDTITKFGRLYNWYAVSYATLCPTGWHVPSDVDWNILQNYLIANGYNYDGTITDNKIAKSIAATTDWALNATIGTVGYERTTNNSTGFTALPGGGRSNSGAFSSIVSNGYWWSSTEINTNDADYRNLYYDNSNLYNDYVNKVSGFSVRCLRN